MGMRREDGWDASGRALICLPSDPFLSPRPQSYGGLRRTLGKAGSCQPYLGALRTEVQPGMGCWSRHMLWWPTSLYAWAPMCPAPPSGHLGRREAGSERQAWVPWTHSHSVQPSGIGMGQRLTPASLKAP